MAKQEEKLKDIHNIKQAINAFIERYYADDVVKIEIHKNKSMGKQIAFKIYPMGSVERY